MGYINISGLDGMSPILSPSSTISLPSSSPASIISHSPHDTTAAPLLKKVKKNTKKILRSRFGCESCKTKRVKCDEVRPSCSRCHEKGIKCNYKLTLQFREDLENQGKKFGREGVWLKKKSQDTATELVHKSKDSYYMMVRNTNHLMFINYTYADLEHLQLVPSIQPSIIPHDILNNSSYDHPSLSFALNYYIEFIAPIFNPIMEESSHYIEEVILHGSHLRIEKGLNLVSLVQYAQNYHHVFYLVLSLGSIYLSKFQKGNNANWILQSQNFQKLGIAQIKRKLVEINDEEDPIVSTDIMLSLVLLILYELANDGNESWSNYLKLAKKLRNSRNFINPNSSLEQSLFTFALEFCHYQESMGRTACKDDNSFFMIMDDDSNDQQHDKVISWMGCERRLVDVVSDITDLSFERVNQGITEINYKILCDNIQSKLDSMKLGVDLENTFVELGYSEGKQVDINNSELMIIDPAIDIEQFCFILSCEIKTMSLELYLQCCLLNKTPSNVESQIKRICKMLKYIILKNDFKWSSTLLWSIFIVGSEISIRDPDCEDLRYLILQMLQKLETYSLGNVNKARQVIMNVWKKRDLDDGDDNSFGDISKHHTSFASNQLKNIGFKNDWERYVFDEKLKISLA